MTDDFPFPKVSEWEAISDQDSVCSMCVVTGGATRRKWIPVDFASSYSACVTVPEMEAPVQDTYAPHVLRPPRQSCIIFILVHLIPVLVHKGNVFK
jgi:hypothetical protein